MRSKRHLPMELPDLPQGFEEGAMSASETGLRKCSQKTWSPSAFQNKLSTATLQYYDTTSNKTKRNKTKLKTSDQY